MNADDVEGVLAAMSGFAVFWEDMTDVETIHGGTAALREFFTGSLMVTGEFTGEPVMSGPFVAVPTRLSTDVGLLLRRGVPLLDQRRQDRPPGLRPGLLAAEAGGT